MRFRRIAILLPWVALPLAVYLALATDVSQFVVIAVFVFPIVVYLFVLNVVEPWLERRSRG